MPDRRSYVMFRRGRSAVGLDWPGRGEGLSDRESEILALITEGRSNAEVAALTYLSPNLNFSRGFVGSGVLIRESACLAVQDRLV